MNSESGSNPPQPRRCREGLISRQRLVSALEERDRQIQRLLQLLQEKGLLRKITDARVDEAC